MTKELSFKDSGWEDYLYWQTQDKRTLKKINTLLKDIDRSPFSGEGKLKCKMAYTGNGTESPLQNAMPNWLWRFLMGSSIAFLLMPFF